MSQYEKHVFVCTYGPYCWFDGDTDGIFERLKRRVAQADLRDQIRVNRSGCLNHCGHGPMIVVYPEGVWYQGVSLDDVDVIFEQHLCGNQPVQRLLLALPPGNNKQTQDYPAPVHQMKQVEKAIDAQRAQARDELRHEIRAASSPLASLSTDDSVVGSTNDQHGADDARARSADRKP